MEAANLNDLKPLWGTVHEPELLVRALTHRSLAHEHRARASEHKGSKTRAGTGDNERLEFLGDAVLGLVVAEALFKIIPSGTRASSPASAPSWSAASTWRRSPRRSVWASICA